ncbi:MAG: ATPase [Methanosarcinales archaeon]|nr:ATPase [Methanosarcinales archaeon]
MVELQSKISSLVRALEDLRLHIGSRDLTIGDQHQSAMLYFSLANACLCNRAVLLYGGMGANKTTLVNLLGSAFMDLSYPEVENFMISGHPEQTEEKIIGFIDPRQWTSGSGGEIRVLWSSWARSRWKVINEINRFPSGKQNLFLEIIQKQKLSYAGQVLEPGPTCYFATMNPDFSATYPVDEALMDRISACVPATQPDFLGSLALGERVREVRDLAEELPRFTPQERDSLPRLVAGVPLGGLAELAIVSLIRDFTLCERSPGRDKTQLSGTKPSRGLCAGCHYFNNPEVCCWQVDQGLSDRARQDLRDFTRAVSFVAGLQGAPQVEVLRAVAPYVIWHRLAPNRSLVERPPYYGARILPFIADLVEQSINRTVNERGEMNLIFSRAVDGEISPRQAIKELSGYDDPIARLDYIPALERMV